MNKIEIGSKVYYTGDVCNADGWFVLKSIRSNGTFDLHEVDNDRKFLAVYEIGQVYAGHGGIRFVTEAAYNEYRAAQMTNLLLAAIARNSRKVSQ